MVITQAADMKSTCQRYWNHVVTDSLRIRVASFIFELTYSCGPISSCVTTLSLFYTVFGPSDRFKFKAVFFVTNKTNRFLIKITDWTAISDSQPTCPAGLTEWLIVELKTRQNNRVWIGSRVNGYKNSTSLCLSVVDACINDDTI